MIKKITYSLQGRLTLALLVSFIAVTLFSAYLLLTSTNQYQKEATQIMHRDLAEHVAHHYTFDEQGVLDYKKIKGVFHELMILGPNFEFYVLDNKGKIMAYSAEKHKIKRKSVSLNHVNLFLATPDIQTPIFGDDPRGENRQKIFSVSPIEKDGAQIGYIYVIIGSEIYDRISDMLFDSQIIRWGASLFVIGLIFSLLVTVWVTGMITQPLNRLTQQVHTIQDRGLTRENITSHEFISELAEWQDDNPNQIHLLGNSFKQALEKLSEQYEKVVTIDELRQELLSHISHDLRTPLASMLGYLETWELKQKELTPEMSAKYIRTAKANAKKISVLIEQLFELAHLDSGNVQVNHERFSLAELVQDVLVKFDIRARKKNIKLQVTPKDSTICVIGDIEKLDRVFTNLIENAIRHTGAGGSINVRLSHTAGFVAVEVTDTGIGIPADDLPHVFEPHYKAGNSVRENTAHGGLGLAITKKLLGLHQTTIKVTSKINQGTTFTFSLPTALPG